MYIECELLKPVKYIFEEKILCCKMCFVALWVLFTDPFPDWSYLYIWQHKRGNGETEMIFVIASQELQLLPRQADMIFVKNFTQFYTAKVHNLRHFSHKLRAQMHQISIIWAFFGYKWAN